MKAPIYFDNKNIRIYFADVQHIEYQGTANTPNGLFLITKFTNYSFEKDMFDNPCYIHEKDKEGFLIDWQCYKKSKEIK